MSNKYAQKVIFLYCPFFIILYNLTGNLSNDIYLPTLPALANDLDISSTLSQLTMTVWFAGVALPQIYFGFIADKMGYRPLILWGALLFIGATFSCWLAPNIYILLLGRFVQGVGVSSLNIATFATTHSHYYDEQHSVRFISWVNITGSIAPLLGPVIGSILFQFFGWRSSFLCILILACIAFTGLYYFMIEGSSFQNKNISFGIWSSLTYYKKIITNELMRPVITYTAFLAALIAYLTTAPFIIHEQFAIPIKYFGLTQLMPFTCFILGSLLVNRLIKYFSLISIIGYGLTLSVWCIFSLVFFVFRSEWVNLYSYLVTISLFLFSFALIGSPLMSIALGSSANKGGAAALLGLSMSLMASAASLLTALFYNGDFRNLCLIITLFLSIGILNYLLLYWRK